MGYISDKVKQLEINDRVVLNAFIVAGIVFISTLSTTYPPTGQNLYSAVIGFTLALLTQLKTLTGNSDSSQPGMLV